MRLRRQVDLARVNRSVAELALPEAVWKSCPWQPRELIETGLRQWLRCAGAALRYRQVIGMPSHAVDEAWHGLILCTSTYSVFCESAYSQFLHHHPDGLGSPSQGSMIEQLRRTVVAWTLVAGADETCVLWDLDFQVALDEPWGIEQEQVDAVLADVTKLSRR